MIGTKDGMHKLITLINELTKLNPCVAGDMRLDNRGFARRLPKMPIVVPQVLVTLAAYQPKLG